MKFNIPFNLSIFAAATGLSLISAVAPVSAQVNRNNEFFEDPDSLITDYNYVGIGASSGGLAVNSKFTLADHLSIRPTVLADIEFDDESDVTVLIPITYDFESPFRDTRLQTLLPYAGAGIGGTSEDGGALGAVAVAGLDYRINSRLTANASFNWALFDGGDANFVIGAGYTF